MPQQIFHWLSPPCHSKFKKPYSWGTLVACASLVLRLCPYPISLGSFPAWGHLLPVVLSLLPKFPVILLLSIKIRPKIIFKKKPNSHTPRFICCWFCIMFFPPPAGQSTLFSIKFPDSGKAKRGKHQERFRLGFDPRPVWACVWLQSKPVNQLWVAWGSAGLCRWGMWGTDI